jgi:hypothetical protein
MPIDENGQEIPDQPGDPSPAPDPGPVTIDPGTPADPDAKAKASQDADKAKDAEVAADLKAIGKPFVEEVDGGGFLIHYPTTKADGSPGYSSESGVGADTPVPAGADV